VSYNERQTRYSVSLAPQLQACQHQRLDRAETLTSLTNTLLFHGTDVRLKGLQFCLQPDLLILVALTGLIGGG
jgi:hypothetical protein